jgi:putative hemolysin
VKIKISNSFAFLVIVIIACALGFSFWLGSKFGNSEFVDPRFHMKKFNDMRNMNDKINQIANPASVFCVEKKGKLEIRTDEDGNQTGYCILKNGKECEEWAFFRGECGK